ncbi:MAG: hypothetical protein ABIH82_06275 [Candidatus Woesearchaeota archaeon]|nr:hypothetical protein [Nanoarchaeota archaeon]MBU1622923.1 hypothetical protein [Nanoarchaeota archaeon]MBU1973795.1 hypothetical protein [Nanoarchaeota archaeon]
MTQKNGKLSREQFYKELAEAKKDPQFRKEIRAFIKASTGVYKLKDYGMENL